MRCLKVEKSKIQPVKRLLIDNSAIDFDYLMGSDDSFGYFSIVLHALDDPKLRSKLVEVLGSEPVFSDFVLKENKKKRGTLKELLSGKLSDEELSYLKTSMDVVGDIAILEIDDELSSKEKLIAEEFLMVNKAIKTVVKKSGKHQGIFRIQDHEFLAGENKSITIDKENNVRLKVDINKMYFSSRFSTERLRIADLVMPGEDVLVMFSGCAPFPCVISKNSDAANVVGIEINPDAHRFGLENIKINKLSNVSLVCGDVREEVPKLSKKFDRIVMPLPMDAGDFLDTALLVSKKNTKIHVYDFRRENDFDKAIKKVEDIGKENGVLIKVSNVVKCGQFSPRVFRVCLDCVII